MLPIRPPPPNIIPNSFPPNFYPKTKNIQINSIPSPLNLNGNIPYVIWVNGEKLNLDPLEVKKLAESLNIKYSPPPNTAKIHSGEGWLYPFSIKK